MEKIGFDLEVNADLRRALVGGLLAALVTAGGAWAVGHLSNAEARLLMEAALPRMQSLAGTVLLASATILALMLTVLGISRSTETSLKAEHYRRVRRIAFLDAAVFVFAMVVSLILNVPLVESEKVTPRWYNAIYYAALGGASLMGGALISVVLMIYQTVRNVIEVVEPDVEDPAIVASEGEGPREEPERSR